MRVRPAVGHLTVVQGRELGVLRADGYKSALQFSLKILIACVLLRQTVVGGYGNGRVFWASLYGN